MAALRQLLPETGVFHGDQQREFEARLTSLTCEPESAVPLCILLRPEESEAVKSAAAVFLERSLTGKGFAEKGTRTFADLSDDIRNQIRSMCLELLGTTMSRTVFHQFMGAISYLYKATEGEWIQLVPAATQMLEAGRVWEAAKLLSSIVPDMAGQYIDDNREYFLGVSEKAFQLNDKDSMLVGVSLYVLVCIRVGEILVPDTQLRMVLELAGNSAEIFGTECGKFWNFLRLFLEVLHDEIPREVCEQIIVIAVRIASNEDVDIDSRSAVIDTTLPLLKLSNKEVIMQIWTLCLGIRARSLEETDSIEGSEMEHFEKTAKYFSHKEVYPLIQDRIMAAIQSQNVFLQAAGLLVVRVLMTNFKDAVYNDAQQVAELTEKALQSDNEVLISSALLVVQAFCSWELMNTQSVRFLPILLKLLAHPSTEVREQTYVATNALLEGVDAEIPQLFGAVEEVFGAIPAEDRYKFISILAKIIELTEDFEDEQMDKSLELLAGVMDMSNTENLDEKSAAFDLAIAILHKDEAQLECISQMVLPVLRLVWEQGESSNRQECLIFVGNLAVLFRGETVKLVGDMLEPMVASLAVGVDWEIRACAVQNLSLLCKHSDDTIRQQIIGHLYPAIRDGFSSGTQEFGTMAAVSVKNIASFIGDAEAQEFVEIMCKLAEEDPDDALFENSMLSLARILKHAKPEILPVILERISNLLKLVISGDVAILADISLLESPVREDVFPPTAAVMSSIFMHPTPFTTDICKFLLDWMSSEDGLSLSNAVGTLSDGIVHNTISPELHPVIVSSVIANINEDKGPGFCQNVVFLFNALLQVNPGVLSTVMQALPTIEKWRAIGSSAKYGYQDVLANIGSLYLEIASLTEELPKEALVAGLEQFPPFDVKETTSMLKCIIKIASTTKVMEVIMAIGMAISRFIVMGESKQAKASVPEEVVQQAFAMFRQLVAQTPNLGAELQAKFARQRSKQRKIMAVLNA